MATQLHHGITSVVFWAPCSSTNPQLMQVPCAPKMYFVVPLDSSGLGWENKALKVSFNKWITNYS